MYWLYLERCQGVSSAQGLLSLLISTLSLLRDQLLLLQPWAVEFPSKNLNPHIYNLAQIQSDKSVLKPAAFDIFFFPLASKCFCNCGCLLGVPARHTGGVSGEPSIKVVPVWKAVGCRFIFGPSNLGLVGVEG